ncbi:MAG: efflux RND transporter periplasmic adaptor subunit [Deltaproteobacteria bacterium]|nr:MAG: efflux RND transporter periplasmic adaptor subunit [Deltaproteobacteria bacterium]
MKADRHRETFHRLFVALAAVASLLPAPPARAADPGGAAPAAGSAVVTFESIPGSTVKRVILTAKAAERLGIETGKVGEKPVVEKQMVSGLVIHPMEKQARPKPAGGVFGGFGLEAEAPAPRTDGAVFGGFMRVSTASASPPAGNGTGDFPPAASVSERQPVASRAKPSPNGDVWILVTLSPAEWDRLAKNKPARLLPLALRDKPEKGILARPTGMAPLEDMKRSMMSLYYVVPGKDHGLTVNRRMRVELQLSGSEKKRKVVPYGAVYYDAKGVAWVYVNSRPLAFERQRVEVERVAGDLAVLSDGPSVGTPVVTVGAAMLYGTEIFGK